MARKYVQLLCRMLYTVRQWDWHKPTGTKAASRMLVKSTTDLTVVCLKVRLNRPFQLFSLRFGAKVYNYTHQDFHEKIKNF